MRQSAPLLGSSGQPTSIDDLLAGKSIISECQGVLRKIQAQAATSAGIDQNLVDQLLQLKTCLSQKATVQRCIEEITVEQLVNFSDTCYLVLLDALSLYYKS